MSGRCYWYGICGLCLAASPSVDMRTGVFARLGWEDLLQGGEWIMRQAPSPMMMMMMIRTRMTGYPTTSAKPTNVVELSGSVVELHVCKLEQARYFRLWATCKRGGPDMICWSWSASSSATCRRSAGATWSASLPAAVNNEPLSFSFVFAALTPWASGPCEMRTEFAVASFEYRTRSLVPVPVLVLVGVEAA